MLQSVDVGAIHLSRFTKQLKWYSLISWLLLSNAESDILSLLVMIKIAMSLTGLSTRVLLVQQQLHQGIVW